MAVRCGRLDALLSLAYKVRETNGGDMAPIIKFLGTAFLVVTVCGFGPLLNALYGAVGGWAVSLLYNDTILGILAQLGLKNVAMWQVGATAGFFSWFLRQQKFKAKN